MVSCESEHEEAVAPSFHEPDGKVLLSCPDESRPACVECTVDLGFEVRGAT
jgi:hypothetical protein